MGFQIQHFEIIAVKDFARNQNDLNAKLQIAITSARINIFSRGKKFLEVHQKLYLKQPKNDF